MDEKNLIKEARITPNCVFSDHDGEKVILNFETGKYFKLNSMGSKVFNLVSENRSIKSILKITTEEFEDDPKIIKKDLLSFIDKCIDLNLVELK